MTTRRKFIKDTVLGGAVFILPSFKLLPEHQSDKFAGGDEDISLSGNWHFKLDPENKGITQQWQKALFVDSARLPGSAQAQGYGNQVTADTEWWDGKLKGVWATSPVYEKYRQPGNVKNYEFLQPQKHYLGACWYSKQFILPNSWKGKRVILFLERVHWQSTLYINGREAGSQMYLGVPHEYDITKQLIPGSNIITIRIDNSKIVDVGEMPSSISEQTQGTWNGIVGKIKLRVTDRVWIADAQVYPDIQGRKIKILLETGNITGTQVNSVLKMYVTGQSKQPMQTVNKKVIINPGATRFEFEYLMGSEIKLWDEHTPYLYTLNLNIAGQADKIRHDHRVIFGMRELNKKGTQFTVNNKPIHIRGNVDTAIFPIDGCPEMGIAWWKKIWHIYKEWGMNGVRFHSWCPPEAAFSAADEVGLYLQPECGDWSNVHTPEQFEFYKKESMAILKQYGNHPSFITLSVGNEKSIKEEYLEELFTLWKKDKRRLYNGKTGGKPLLDSCDFYVGGATKNGVRARYYLGWPPTPGPSYFYQFAPSTSRDYTAGIKGDKRPFIAHEICQRCAYPDVINLPHKFIGSLKPTYLDIARDQLQERGMLNQVADFVNASGKWQVQMYKEEIEANLRSAGIGGFHLLSLQDFPGQGTAPVGFMDFFYDAKPYVSAPEIRRFCGPVTLLARMNKRTWFANERFEADIQLYNFSGKTLSPLKTVCIIKTDNGKIIYQKEIDARAYTAGSVQPVGSFEADLDGLIAPAKYTLEISRGDINNYWDFWVYPEKTPVVKPQDIMIAEVLNNEVIDALDNGKKVLLVPKRNHLKGNLVQCFGTFYWTAFDFHGGETSACGLLTDPQHPVFNYFPTDFHGNWQWWELLTQASPMILDDFEAKHPWPKHYKPLIQMIPSWKVNRKLSVLTEVKAGKGKLMLCSMDIMSDLDNRKVAAQFRYSLLKYMLSENFKPSEEVGYNSLQEIFI